jgi:hypothetical protein
VVTLPTSEDQNFEKFLLIWEQFEVIWEHLVDGHCVGVTLIPIAESKLHQDTAPKNELKNLKK